MQIRSTLPPRNAQRRRAKKTRTKGVTFIIEWSHKKYRSALFIKDDDLVIYNSTNDIEILIAVPGKVIVS